MIWFSEKYCQIFKCLKDPNTCFKKAVTFIVATLELGIIDSFE